MGRAICTACFPGRQMTLPFTKAADKSDLGTYGILQKYRFWYLEPRS